MKPKSKLLSLLLAICLVAGLMPTAAFAADGDKTIMLGTSGIKDPTAEGNTYYTPNSYIYYGKNGETPIKWRVLDADKANDNSTDGMFLLSEYLLENTQFHDSSNAWQGSTAQAWCETFASNTSNFSAAEQSAMLGIAKTDSTESNLYSLSWGESSLTADDKMFFLSVRELADYVGSYDGAPGLTATFVGGSAGVWWLRSPDASNTDFAGAVLTSGSVSDSIVNYDWAARPAFNLDLTSVLFTSAAVGGKSASGMDSGLTAIGNYAGNEWKLTLLDSTRNFSVTVTTPSGKPGDTITLNYTGATTGENEYISVIIADENGAQYYGRVAQPGGESGTATLSIPADLAPGSYTLNVFSEQYNGDYKTDYASAFAEVALTVEEAAAPGIDTGKAIQLVDSGTAANIGGGQADNIYFGTYQQSSDDSDGYNIDPIKWRVLENADGQLFLLSDQNLDVFQYHTDRESVTWEKSTMRSWLNGYSAEQNTGGSSGIDYTSDNFIGAAFSEKEQGAIADTTVVNDDNPTYGTEGGENTNDKIFLLSIAEAQNSSYFADNSSRIATNTAYVAGGGKIGLSSMYGVGKADNWWLRSPGVDDDIAAYVNDNGGVRSFGPNVDFVITAVRPAFNLDLTSVLFTSAAVGGKIPAASSDGNQGGEADAIFEIGDYDGSEWKLTLLDNSRNFVVTEEAASGKPGDTITLNYTGATTGTNEYISVIIADSSGAQYYGRVAQPTDTGGTVEITIPSGLADGTYTLYVFSEQYNGGEQDDTKLTDYASAFETVALTVSSDTTIAPSYGISASLAALDFGSQTVGYTEAPAAQTVTLTNTGNQDVTVTLPSSEKYTITAREGFAKGTATLTPNGTATFTVQPNTGLGVGNYAETLTVSGSNNTSAQVALSFSVVEAAPDTYILTVNLNGGSGGTTGGAYAGGAVVNIDAGSRSNYRFNGWTSSNGGSFADASSASTTFTMPAADTTITAAWSYIGGGGSTTDYYRLTFETNGGSEISSIRRAEYTTIDLTDYTPTREGYEFTGWYADEALTEKITSIRLIRNTTVYAGWEEIKENPSTGFENPFTDVSESDWFFNDVKFVYQNGLMNGTSATTFSPEGTTSRGMIVTILWRMAGSPDMEDKIWGYPFADVDATAYYGTAVYWARLNGIAGGYDDATFGPNDPITREQMAAILYRYAQYKGYDVSAKADLNKFTDADEISNYALEALQWANAEGLINGKGDGVLDPKGQATRAEAAVILTRFNEVVAE